MKRLNMARTLMESDLGCNRQSFRQLETDVPTC